MLALLEQHHLRLASIVKSRSEPPTALPCAEKDIKADLTGRDTVTKLETARKTTTSTVDVISPVRPRRDASSAIASNLATARGIPHQSATSRARQTSPSGLAQTTRNPQRALQSISSSSITPPSQQPRQIYQPPSQVTSEDSFQKFYSSFGGLVSKLTAPLAFAGLPLHSDDMSPANSSKPAAPLSDRTTATSADPAISRLFSRASLRAIQDRQGPSGVQESFFVVPTSGGTMRYSSVLAAQDKSIASKHTRNPSTASDAPEHFVDALQTQQPRIGNTPIATTMPARPNIMTRKSSASTSNTNPGNTQKTLEELELENASLKQLTDKLSHRLYDWEKNAQNQSIALQQSILSLNSQRAPSTSTARKEAATTLREDKDMLALENALERAQKDLERFGRENEKLKTVVLRYRERWDKLKEGARVRREREEKGGKGEDEKERQDESREGGSNLNG